MECYNIVFPERAAWIVRMIRSGYIPVFLLFNADLFLIRLIMHAASGTPYTED